MLIQTEEEQEEQLNIPYKLKTSGDSTKTIDIKYWKENEKYKFAITVDSVSSEDGDTEDESKTEKEITVNNLDEFKESALTTGTPAITSADAQLAIEIYEFIKDSVEKAQNLTLKNLGSTQAASANIYWNPTITPESTEDFVDSEDDE